jgi:trimeric autotransporter adhesin
MTARLAGSAATILFLCSTAPRVCAQSPAEAREIGATSVPRLVQFNGTLKDAAMRPVSGVASVTFAIYAEQDGGAALWSETQNILADANGHYAALLGTATTGGFPAELFGTGQSRWLGITIARAAEMPRVLLASVPYAMKAGDADTLGGLPASSYVTTQQLAARSAIAAPATTILATPNAAPTASTNPTVDSAAQSVTQATPSGGGTTNFLPLWTSPTILGDSLLFQTAGRIGVGTTKPSVLLDVNGNSIFRGSVQLAPQSTATAASGQPSHSYQWEASTYNSSTKSAVTTAFGFRATPQNNNTANATSSLDLYFGPAGNVSDTGFSFSNTGIVTFVPGQTFNGSSITVNSISLPNSTGATSGVVALGGTPILTNYGGSTNVFVGSQAGTSASNGTNNAALGLARTQTSETTALSTRLRSESARRWMKAMQSYSAQSMEHEWELGQLFPSLHCK